MGNIISYINVHNLIHLANDVNNLGSLESFSSFKYESYLGKLKSMVRATSKPLHQISNRIVEENLNDEKKTLMIPSYPIIYYKNKEKKEGIKYIQFCTFIITRNKPDNCCLLRNGTTVIVSDIYKNNKDNHENKSEIKLKVQQFLTQQSFFHIPCRSEVLGISIVNIKNVSDYFIIKVTDINTKCLLLPIEQNNEQYVVMPIIHAHCN